MIRMKYSTKKILIAQTFAGHVAVPRKANANHWHWMETQFHVVLVSHQSFWICTMLLTYYLASSWHSLSKSAKHIWKIGALRRIFEGILALTNFRDTECIVTWRRPKVAALEVRNASLTPLLYGGQHYETLDDMPYAWSSFISFKVLLLILSTC